MLKYIYCPTGREVWSDLASSFYKNGIAEPVIWVGNPKLDIYAENIVSNGTVIGFKEVHSEILSYDLNASLNQYVIFTKINNSPVREKAIKMMDRDDPYGVYRNVDRDAFLNTL